MKDKNIFETLNNINVNEHTEDRDGLTYLSWTWAWSEVKKAYPDANYEIQTFENNLPYVYDEKTGYMVFTSATIGNITHKMWLPVMDSKNKAMKREAYKYTTKYGTKTVEPATMCDINKAIMRCLTKNLAMFGLGLYIYAGQDLPDLEAQEAKEAKEEEKKKEERNKNYKMELAKYCKENNLVMLEIGKKYNINNESKQEEFKAVLEQLKGEK